MVSKRTEALTSFIVMDVLERANEMEREGADIVHLEVGEPDFDTPDCVKAAACKALDEGHTHYTHSLGLYELRENISEYFLNTYQVSVDPDRILVTSGSSPAIFLAFSALLVAIAANSAPRAEWIAGAIWFNANLEAPRTPHRIGLVIYLSLN